MRKSSGRVVATGLILFATFLYAKLACEAGFLGIHWIYADSGFRGSEMMKLGDSGVSLVGSNVNWNIWSTWRGSMILFVGSMLSVDFE